MRGRLPPFLTTKRGFVGACLTFYVVVRIVLDVLQALDYAVSHAGAIASFLASTGGNAVILVVGLFLILWAALSNPTQVVMAERVANIENEGPVTVEEATPDKVEQREGEIVWVDPFRDDPATTVEVKDPSDEYRVSTSYVVRGRANIDGFQLDSAIQVSNEDGEPIRRLFVPAWIQASEDGSWQSTVAMSQDLLGLPVGTYGLNALDFVESLGLEENTRLEYSDMRLTVRKL